MVYARCQRAGQPLGAMDAFFAATARVHGPRLATRNTADFAAAGVDPWRA